MPDDKLSKAALTDYAAKVHTIYDNVIGEERLEDAVGSGYSVRKILACKYVKYARGEKMLADSKFTLFVKYDADDNELDAVIYGVDGQPAPTNQPEPAPPVPEPSQARKLAERLDKRFGEGSWKHLGQATVAGLQGEKVQNNLDVLILLRDDLGAFEVKTV